jgi:hypothetical protein
MILGYAAPADRQGAHPAPLFVSRDETGSSAKKLL